MEETEKELDELKKKLKRNNHLSPQLNRLLAKELGYNVVQEEIQNLGIPELSQQSLAFQEISQRFLEDYNFKKSTCINLAHCIHKTNDWMVRKALFGAGVVATLITRRPEPIVAVLAIEFILKKTQEEALQIHEDIAFRPFVSAYKAELYGAGILQGSELDLGYTADDIAKSLDKLGVDNEDFQGIGEDLKKYVLQVCSERIIKEIKNSGENQGENRINATEKNIEEVKRNYAIKKAIVKRAEEVIEPDDKRINEQIIDEFIIENLKSKPLLEQIAFLKSYPSFFTKAELENQEERIANSIKNKEHEAHVFQTLNQINNIFVISDNLGIEFSTEIREAFKVLNNGAQIYNTYISSNGNYLATAAMASSLLAKNSNPLASGQKQILKAIKHIDLKLDHIIEKLDRVIEFQMRSIEELFKVEKRLNDKFHEVQLAILQVNSDVNRSISKLIESDFKHVKMLFSFSHKWTEYRNGLNKVTSIPEIKRFFDEEKDEFVEYHSILDEILVNYPMDGLDYSDYLETSSYPAIDMADYIYDGYKAILQLSRLYSKDSRSNVLIHIICEDYSQLEQKMFLSETEIEDTKKLLKPNLELSEEIVYAEKLYQVYELISNIEVFIDLFDEDKKTLRGFDILDSNTRMKSFKYYEAILKLVDLALAQFNLYSGDVYLIKVAERIKLFLAKTESEREQYQDEIKIIKNAVSSNKHFRINLLRYLVRSHLSKAPLGIKVNQFQYSAALSYVSDHMTEKHIINDIDNPCNDGVPNKDFYLTPSIKNHPLAKYFDDNFLAAVRLDGRVKEVKNELNPNCSSFILEDKKWVLRITSEFKLDLPEILDDLDQIIFTQELEKLKLLKSEIIERIDSYNIEELIKGSLTGPENDLISIESVEKFINQLKFTDAN